MSLSKLPIEAWLICVGFSFFGSQLMAGELQGVIRDAHWSIEIRPASSRLTETELQAGPAVVPVAYQEEAPAPESKSEPPAGEPKPIGPLLPSPAVTEPSPQPVTPQARMSYAEAYAAIPFSRTEYEANPAYRHQAALELMFGVLRPTTLVQQYTPRASRYPDFYQIPYGRSDTQHINIRSFGGGYNLNGQSPFGYPYGLKGNW